MKKAKKVKKKKAVAKNKPAKTVVKTKKKTKRVPIEVKAVDLVQNGTLSAQQEAFAVAYMANGFNATQAAIEAGYKRRWADNTGSRLSRHPIIVARVRAHLQEMGAKGEAVLLRWVQLAFNLDVADFQGLLTGTTTLKTLRRSGVDTRMIKAITTRTDHKGGHVTRIEFQDSMEALKMLTRILGLDQREPDGPIPAVLVQQQIVNVSMDETLTALRKRMKNLQDDGANAPVGMGTPGGPR